MDKRHRPDIHAFSIDGWKTVKKTPCLYSGLINGVRVFLWVSPDTDYGNMALEAKTDRPGVSLELQWYSYAPHSMELPAKTDAFVVLMALHDLAQRYQATTPNMVEE